MSQALDMARLCAAQLKLMAFDVDGVLTDGTLWFSSAGDEMKGFSSVDGHGLKMLREGGVDLAIITGRRSRAVELRAENLGIARLHQGVEDKRAVLLELAGAMRLPGRRCSRSADPARLRLCRHGAPGRTAGEAPCAVRGHAAGRRRCGARGVRIHPRRTRQA
jgi:3-deoxy-D-manno-octulosonate 8-phosphate phosphatase (KDO 8-P phosphatase)